MTNAEAASPLSDHQPRRPQLVTWIAFGFVADASLLWLLHTVIDQFIPSDASGWSLPAMVAAFAAVPWIVHRTVLPLLLLGLPATPWGKLSRLAYFVPYLGVATIFAFITVALGLYVLGAFSVFAHLVGAPSVVAHCLAGLAVVGACAAGGTICGLFLHFGHAFIETPADAPPSMRADILGGGLAGALSLPILFPLFLGIGPQLGAGPLSALHPAQIATVVVAVGTFALSPHLILTGLEARACPVASRN